MHYLTPRQQRMLLYLREKGVLTRKNQPFWSTPFFYSQMNELVKACLVKQRWKDSSLEYRLASRGVALAELLAGVLEISELIPQQRGEEL